MKSSRDVAVRVAVVYIAVSTAWILGSDFAVSLLPAALAESLQTIKGLIFVGLTGGLLYLLVARAGEQLRTSVRQATASELLLDQVVRTVPMGIVLLSEDGLITFINPTAETLLGTGARDALGQRFDAVAAGSRPESIVDLGELLSTGEFDGLELGPSGQATIARVARIDQGHASSGWVVAVTEVTEARRSSRRSSSLVKAYRFLALASIQMSKSHDRTRVITDVSRLAVDSGGFCGVWCLQSQRDGAVSVSYHGETGCTGEQMSNSLLDAFETGSAGLDELEAAGVVVGESGLDTSAGAWFSSALASSECNSAASFAVTTADGPDLLFVIFAAEHGAFDRAETQLLLAVKSALGFALDRIALDAKRMDAEKALEASERTYRELFERHPQPMWVYDIETLDFLAVNNAAIAKYGHTRETFLTMTIADIRPGEDLPLLRENVSQVSEGFEDAGIWTHLDASGRAFPVHVYSHTITWDGRGAELVMVAEVACME